MIRPDRNPDGFDGYRRRYLADGLAEEAARVMPAKKAREFKRFLASLAPRRQA